jgi:hypothetical protein
MFVATQESEFKPNDIMLLVRTGNIRRLQAIAPGIIASAVALTPKTGSWADLMPSWKSKGHFRGLLGWGQTRDPKTKEIITKRGAIPTVQRKSATEACSEYMEYLALPPVVAGESRKKVIPKMSPTIYIASSTIYITVSTTCHPQYMSRRPQYI